MSVSVLIVYSKYNYKDIIICGVSLRNECLLTNIGLSELIIYFMSTVSIVNNSVILMNQLSQIFNNLLICNTDAHLSPTIDVGLQK